MTDPLAPPTAVAAQHLPDGPSGLPRAEALLAGTLALMTGHAQACCDNHRQAMGRKIVTNLQALAETGLFTPHFGTMLLQLQARWRALGAEATDVPGAPDGALSAVERSRTLWVPAPEVLQ